MSGGALGAIRWPDEVRYEKAERTLHVRWDDGVDHVYAAEFLRVHSPSAEVQGHNPSDRITVPGKRTVGISAVEPVGNYAVRLRFDDGHDTGIYSWRFLREAGDRQAEMWAIYLAELEEKGLSRDLRGKK